MIKNHCKVKITDIRISTEFVDANSNLPNAINIILNNYGPFINTALTFKN